jgi:hypothetical protein
LKWYKSKKLLEKPLFAESEDLKAGITHFYDWLNSNKVYKTAELKKSEFGLFFV